jgi:hypothetical protein
MIEGRKLPPNLNGCPPPPSFTGCSTNCFLYEKDVCKLRNSRNSKIEFGKTADSFRPSFFLSLFLSYYLSINFTLFLYMYVYVARIAQSVQILAYRLHADKFTFDFRQRQAILFSLGRLGRLCGPPSF